MGGVKLMDNKEDEKKENSNQSHDELKYKMKQGKLKSTKSIFFGLLSVIVLASLIFVWTMVFGKQNTKLEIKTISTLEKVINISELSTYQAVYNGIAEVRNEIETEQIDYYVSYKAKVNAGFDFENVKILMDEKTKKVTVNIPEIFINDVSVDIGSLDFIFENDKANVSSVSKQAYIACIADVTNESKQKTAIFELADKNAKNVMKALISPFIKQLGTEYELVVTIGGAR